MPHHSLTSRCERGERPIAKIPGRVWPRSVWRTKSHHWRAGGSRGGSLRGGSAHRPGARRRCHRPKHARSAISIPTALPGRRTNASARRPHRTPSAPCRPACHRSGRPHFRFGDRWNHSVAINHVYFACTAPPCTQHAARKKGVSAPCNIGADDGDLVGALPRRHRSTPRTPTTCRSAIKPPTAPGQRDSRRHRDADRLFRGRVGTGQEPAKVSGIGKVFQWVIGQATVIARPIALLTGTAPPPGSSMW